MPGELDESPAGGDRCCPLRSGRSWPECGPSRRHGNGDEPSPCQSLPLWGGSTRRSRKSGRAAGRRGSRRGMPPSLSPPVSGELLLAPPATRGRVLVCLLRVLRDHAGQLGADLAEPGDLWSISAMRWRSSLAVCPQGQRPRSRMASSSPISWSRRSTRCARTGPRNCSDSQARATTVSYGPS
jgi:hypothetical protein